MFYYGWLFAEKALRGTEDPNDPNIPNDPLAAATAGYINMDNMIALMERFTAVDSAATVGDAARLTDSDIEVDATGEKFMRLREGIERFLITDINNPAASARAQSEIVVAGDRLSTEIRYFNHVPGGANILFMDGHVEFLYVYVSTGIWDGGRVLRQRHSGLVRRWGEISGKTPLRRPKVLSPPVPRGESLPPLLPSPKPYTTSELRNCLIHGPSW